MHPLPALLGILTLGLCPLTAEVRSQLFVERDGIVVMEAEHATELRGWEPVTRPDGSGVVMRDAGGALTFKILVERPGRYFVWFRHAKPEGATDKSNDCVVRVNGQQLQVAAGETLHPVIGMGTHQRNLAFESRPKTHETGHRGYHPFFDVSERSVVEFQIVSRSPGYLVDAIALIHHQRGGDDPRPAVLGEPSGPVPAETVFERKR